jgi:dTDP-4-dehydrorhamnose 3,5-epimerase
MKFTETGLPKAYIVDIEPAADERGFFARSWCRREFEAHGINPNVAQCGVSFNHRRGTLRGMHYQAPPQPEAKLVRCTMGSIYDVIVDLRPESRAFGKWFAVELSADNRRMLYVPEGVAHGFQTLEDNTEVLYQISEFFRPECARGVRWNDPAFGIRWPGAEPRIMSQRDMSFEDYRD